MSTERLMTLMVDYTDRICPLLANESSLPSNSISGSGFNVTVPTQLHVAYTVAEIVCSLAALAGNLLGLLVFVR